MKKKVILLVNLGTPDKPDVKHVRRYLSQFLNDKYIIDLPYVFRKLLVNLIIVPFRAPKSARLYQKIWTNDGSPLLFHLNNLTKKLQESLSDDFLVFRAMRYGNPSVKSIIENLKSIDIENITVVPLYPQYATSTTESTKQHVLDIFRKEGLKSEVRFIEQFYSEKPFIEAYAEQIASYHPENFDHILFSYHGVPVNHVQNLHKKHAYLECNCSNKMPEHGKFCYRATCYQTSRLLAEALRLPKDKFSTSFQSRFSENWLKPFTDKTLIELSNSGKKRVLVVSPSFVADCLETICEIDIEYKQLFLENNGGELVLVESLNDRDQWIKALEQIITKIFLPNKTEIE